MWRMLLLATLLGLAALPALAHDDPSIRAWQACAGTLVDGGPRLTACRPLVGRIDPQGRELWLRGEAQPLTGRERGPSAVFVIGTASSEAWFNGAPLGANGRPGATAGAEVAGRYIAVLPIPDRTWRAQGNEVVVRLSAFYAPVRLDAPIGGIWIGPIDAAPPIAPAAIAYVAAGALAAAAFGFGAIFAMRRTGSSLTLAAMSGVAALQAVVESLRALVNYPYPLHIWRLTAIWALAAVFALLLVAFAATRFLPGRRRSLLAATGVVMLAGAWLPGFDHKTATALLAGVGVAAVAAAAGVEDRREGARPALAYLLAFAALGLAWPSWLLDLSFFVLAAILTLPLLVVEVVR
ncbi:MAG: DNA-binding response regulator, partial [Phenylobacterium sp.]